MQYTLLGTSQLKVSRICLGMMSFGSPLWREWILSEELSLPLIKAALDLGINFFDTANVYSHGLSEEITGRAIKAFTRREDVVIATKLYYPLKQDALEKGLSKAQIHRAVEGSLRRLGTDYIDLYQMHRWDYFTPIEETLEAFHELVVQGKVRYIGASSMYAWQFAKASYLAKHNSWTSFLTMQNHYNLVYREEEKEMIPLCADLQVALMPWSPLARGFLTGTRRPEDYGDTLRAKTDKQAQSLYFQENDFEILDRVRTLAESKGVSCSQIALAWLLHKKSVATPIIGITKNNHLKEAVAAIGLALSSEEILFLEEPYKPHPILTFDMDKKENLSAVR